MKYIELFNKFFSFYTYFDDIRKQEISKIFESTINTTDMKNQSGAQERLAPASTNSFSSSFSFSSSASFVDELERRSNQLKFNIDEICGNLEQVSTGFGLNLKLSLNRLHDFHL